MAPGHGRVGGVVPALLVESRGAAGRILMMRVMLDGFITQCGGSCQGSRRTNLPVLVRSSISWGGAGSRWTRRAGSITELVPVVVESRAVTRLGWRFRLSRRRHEVRLAIHDDIRANARLLVHGLTLISIVVGRE